MSFKLSSVTASILLLSSTVAFAGHQYKDAAFKDVAPCDVSTLMDGFYLGAQAGYDSYNVSENIRVVSAGTTNVANPNINANGFVGGLMLGYGRYINNYFYLGGEAVGNYSNADSSWSANFANISGGSAGAYNSKITVNGSYGLAVLPGIKITDSYLGYVRLGYNWASLKYQESATVVGSASKTNTEGGFVYGLGLETLIMNNWSLRGEYTYTNYGSFNTNMNATSQTSVSPSDNQFMLGLLYHFS